MIVHPLMWPSGRQKTAGNARTIPTSPKTLNPTLATLGKALTAFGATNVRIATNVPVDAYGKRCLGAFTQAFECPGVVVTFKRGTQSYLLTADMHSKVADNAYSVLRQVEALRALEKHSDREMAAKVIGAFRVEVTA